MKQPWSLNIPFSINQFLRGILKSFLLAAIVPLFQLFFTSKLTGQGTGLGLSLSYDIIKAHGGEIMADSEEGEGSTFIIQLPMV